MDLKKLIADGGNAMKKAVDHTSHASRLTTDTTSPFISKTFVGQNSIHI